MARKPRNKQIKIRMVFCCLYPLFLSSWREVGCIPLLVFQPRPPHSPSHRLACFVLPFPGILKPATLSLLATSARKSSLPCLKNLYSSLLYLTAPFQDFIILCMLMTVGSCTQLIPFLHSCVSHTPMPLHSLVPERHLTNEFVPCPGGWVSFSGVARK